MTHVFLIFRILKGLLIYIDRKGRGPHFFTRLPLILPPPPPSWDRQALPATQRKKEQERAKVANHTDRDIQGASVASSLTPLRYSGVHRVNYISPITHDKLQY
jgi:hypothetical protein